MQDRVCDDELLIIQKPKVGCVVVPHPQVKGSASIILRGANDFMLDEMERSLHDALCVVSTVSFCGPPFFLFISTLFSFFSR